MLLLLWLLLTIQKHMGYCENDWIFWFTYKGQVLFKINSTKKQLNLGIIKYIQGKVTGSPNTFFPFLPFPATFPLLGTSLPWVALVRLFKRAAQSSSVPGWKKREEQPWHFQKIKHTYNFCCNHYYTLKHLHGKMRTWLRGFCNTADWATNLSRSYKQLLHERGGLPHLEWVFRFPFKQALSQWWLTMRLDWHNLSHSWKEDQCKGKDTFFCKQNNGLFGLQKVHVCIFVTTNFLGMYCYFPVIWLVNFVKVTPVKVVAPWKFWFLSGT